MQQFHSSQNPFDGEGRSIRTDLVFHYIPAFADREFKANELANPGRRHTLVIEGDVDIRQVGEIAAIDCAIVSGDVLCAAHQKVYIGRQLVVGGELRGDSTLFFDSYSQFEIWGDALSRYSKFKAKSANTATLAKLARSAELDRNDDDMLLVPGSADLSIFAGNKMPLELANAVVLGDLNFRRGQNVAISARGRGAVVVLGDVHFNGSRPMLLDPDRFLVEGRLVA